MNFLLYLDAFSFHHENSKSQCTSADVVEFIENTIEHSKSGQFMFFIRSHIPGLFLIFASKFLNNKICFFKSIGQPMTPVRLLYPVSRFAYMSSLKHIARFVIHRQIRRDRIDELDLPPGLKSFLKQAQIYTENIPSSDGT